MFANMKLAVKLGLGFAATLALLLIISVVSYARLGALDKEVNDLVTDKYPKIIDATDVIRAMNQVAQINRNLLLINDPVETQKQLARMTEQRKIITDNINALESKITSEEGKKKLKLMNETRATYVAVLERFLVSVQRGERDAALKLLYGDMRPVTDSYMAAIRDLITFQDELMKKVGKDTSELVNATERLILILGSAAALLSVLMGWIITRSVVKQLGGEPDYARDMVTRLAEGDLTMKVQTHANDNTSLLYAMRRCPTRS